MYECDVISVVGRWRWGRDSCFSYLRCYSC